MVCLHQTGTIACTLPFEQHFLLLQLEPFISGFRHLPTYDIVQVVTLRLYYLLPLHCTRLYRHFSLFTHGYNFSWWHACWPRALSFDMPRTPAVPPPFYPARRRCRVSTMYSRSDRRSPPRALWTILSRLARPTGGIYLTPRLPVAVYCARRPHTGRYLCRAGPATPPAHTTLVLNTEVRGGRRRRTAIPPATAYTIHNTVPCHSLFDRHLTTIPYTWILFCLPFTVRRTPSSSTLPTLPATCLLPACLPAFLPAYHLPVDGKAPYRCPAAYTPSCVLHTYLFAGHAAGERTTRHTLRCGMRHRSDTFCAWLMPAYRPLVR